MIDYGLMPLHIPEVKLNLHDTSHWIKVIGGILYKLMNGKDTDDVQNEY